MRTIFTTRSSLDLSLAIKVNGVLRKVKFTSSAIYGSKCESLFSADAELAEVYQPILREHGIEVSDEVAGQVAGIMKERATFASELWDLTSYFFVAPTEYDEKQVKKYWKGENPRILAEVREVLASIDDFSKENTETIVHGWIAEKGYGVGQVMNSLRLALVGAGKGPGMYDVTAFLGKEECLKRIDALIANVKPIDA